VTARIVRLGRGDRPRRGHTSSTAEGNSPVNGEMPSRLDHPQTWDGDNRLGIKPNSVCDQVGFAPVPIMPTMGLFKTMDPVEPLNGASP
jgi:hypothetical protein